MHILQKDVKIMQDKTGIIKEDISMHLMYMKLRIFFEEMKKKRERELEMK